MKIRNVDYSDENMYDLFSMRETKGAIRMAKTYHLGLGRRFANWLFKLLLPIGLVPAHIYLLTVRGRNSGQIHSTPVQLVERDGRRWLVSPYGEVNWVRNARAAGWVALSRGRRSEKVKIVELEPGESAQVLRAYLQQVPLTQPFFDSTPRSPHEAFVSEAPRHPVFRILDPMDDQPEVEDKR